MEFFNRKQEVIDIQLTPYGRRKLSTGEWRPRYYAFFDRDVIYDVGHVGFEENQKESHDRIKGAVRPKAMPITYGIESLFMQQTKEYDANPKQGTWSPPADLTFPSFTKPSPIRNLRTMKLPLGNSSLNSSYYPSFALKFYEGVISSSFEFYTGSAGQTTSVVGPVHTLPIAQINCNVNYVSHIKSGGIVVQDNNEPASTEFAPEVAEPGLEFDPPENRTYSPEVYKDGTYVTIQTQKLLFDLIEEHVPIDKEDFDLEVYEIRTNTYTKGGTTYEKEKLKQLTFIGDYFDDNMINYGNVIYNKDTKEYIPVESKHVEYYFDVRVDKEIEPDPPGTQSVNLTQPLNPEEPCADE
tara:strand:- start:1162 stop:2220 length:1059 start_codon:yes stop_codon:yes gene_type:complete